MIQFHAIWRHDARAAFAYAEQVKARGLRDHASAQAQEESAAPASLDERLARIPDNVTVLEYVQLPEVLVVWPLRRGSREMRVPPPPGAEVARPARQLRSAMPEGGPLQSVKEIAASAFDRLLGPVLRDLPAETELVVVPDRELVQVPFAALFDT